MKLLKLLSTFLIASVMALTACNGGGKSSGTNTNSDLELLYFGKPVEETVQPQPQSLRKNKMLKAPYHYIADEVDDKEDEEDDVYNMEFLGRLDLEAHVKNTKRLSFVDIVVYSASTGKKYVFNDGNGEYRVESSTVLDNEVWTTKLRFSNISWELIEKTTTKASACMFDTYLEIEEINFLNLDGDVTKSNITKGKADRVNIHATDGYNSSTHTWTEWETVERSCEECAGRKHTCTVCGVEHFERASGNNVNWEDIAPLGHIYNGEWEIVNAVPGVLSSSDTFRSVGTCSRCGKVISQYLSGVHDINDFEYDLVIPSDIVRIEASAFEVFPYLKTIRFPAGIAYLGTRAFAECPNLTDVYFEGSVPPEMGGELFDPIWRDENNPFKIHVPVDALATYQAVDNQYWQDFAVSRLVADINNQPQK